MPPDNNFDIIYKIFRGDEWAIFTQQKIFYGSHDDKRDGFIHLSTQAQLRGTLDKHYTQGAPLILAAVRTEGLVGLKYETSRGGAQFPHLYTPLGFDNVTRHWPLSADSQGRYVLPV